jgi:hypothetical protein
MFTLSQQRKDEIELKIAMLRHIRLELKKDGEK